MNLTILFENESFVVVDKPYGVVSTPTRIGVKETRPILGLLLQEQLKTKIFPVHRLDTPVTGIILFAKEAAAHRAASQWFEQHKVQKFYHAFSAVPPLTEWKEGMEETWQCRLTKGKKRAYLDEQRGKSCITHVKLEKTNPDFFAWILSPQTGRSHQLRFELYRHQMPILGDTLYGGRRWTPPAHLGGEGDCIALRHSELCLKQIKNENRFGLPEKLSVRNLN